MRPAEPRFGTPIQQQSCHVHVATQGCHEQRGPATDAVVLPDVRIGVVVQEELEHHAVCDSGSQHQRRALSANPAATLLNHRTPIRCGAVLERAPCPRHVLGFDSAAKGPADAGVGSLQLRLKNGEALFQVEQLLHKLLLLERKSLLLLPGGGEPVVRRRDLGVQPGRHGFPADVIAQCRSEPLELVEIFLQQLPLERELLALQGVFLQPLNRHEFDPHRVDLGGGPSDELPQLDDLILRQHGVWAAQMQIPPREQCARGSRRLLVRYYTMSEGRAKRTEVSAWVPPPKMAEGTAPSSYTTCKAATGRRSWMVAMGLLPCNGECTGAGQGLPAHTPFWS